MPPRIALVRVQNQWGGRTSHMRCVARLTRRLTPDELNSLSIHSEFNALDDVVTYTCRPEDVEEREQRLSVLLRRIHARAQGLARRQPRIRALNR